MRRIVRRIRQTRVAVARWWMFGSLSVLCASVVLTLAVTQPLSGVQARPKAQPAATWESEAAWFQQLIFLYASGNAPVQRAALSAGARAGLRPTQVSGVSAAVRAAWVRLMTEDAASLGRVGAPRNLAGQQRVLSSLRAALRQIAGARYVALLDATSRAFTQVSSPSWLRAAGLASTVATSVPGYMTVYATSFQITSKPAILGPPPGQVGYVALPDAYLKYANLGLSSSIPDIYRPFYSRHVYLPAGGNPSYSVDIASSDGGIIVKYIRIADVGPWNEDDNWWDPTNTSATLPPSCPVTGTPRSPASLTNPAVNGICPSTRLWRRIYYYLLYQHYALPFFEPAAYAPTGSYADVTAWPPVLSANCPEASAASINNDGVTCAAGLPNYNAHNGGWLRDGTYNAPILNQSAIDISPEIDQALGWQYPSSGFIQVNVSRLP